LFGDVDAGVNLLVFYDEWRPCSQSLQYIFAEPCSVKSVTVAGWYDAFLVLGGRCLLPPASSVKPKARIGEPPALPAMLDKTADGEIIRPPVGAADH
jgi:hypothetical protein